MKTSPPFPFYPISHHVYWVLSHSHESIKKRGEKYLEKFSRHLVIFLFPRRTVSLSDSLTSSSSPAIRPYYAGYRLDDDDQDPRPGEGPRKSWIFRLVHARVFVRRCVFLRLCLSHALRYTATYRLNQQHAKHPKLSVFDESMYVSLSHTNLPVL